MAVLDFPANPTEGQKYTAENGVVYTWTLIQGVGYWSAASSEADTYLKLDGSNGPITGALGIDGLVTAAGGVKLSGGTQADGNIIGMPNGAIAINDSNRITLTSAADSGTGISIRINSLDKTANVIGLGITTGQTGRTSTTTLNQVYSNLDTDYGSNAYAYVARSTAAHMTAGINITGYYTALNNSDAPNGSVYAFFAGGTAPSYFQGNITCDGTITSSNITSLSTALTAIKAAVSDSSTDDAGKFAAIAAALASF